MSTDVLVSPKFLWHVPQEARRYIIATAIFTASWILMGYFIRWELLKNIPVPFAGLTFLVAAAAALVVIYRNGSDERIPYIFFTVMIGVSVWFAIWLAATNIKQTFTLTAYLDAKGEPVIVSSSEVLPYGILLKDTGVTYAASFVQADVDTAQMLKEEFAATFRKSLLEKESAPARVSVAAPVVEKAGK